MPFCVYILLLVFTYLYVLIPMTWRGTAVAPVLTHWSCRGLAFGHGCSACMIWCEGACVFYCPASRTTLVATRFWVVMICPIIKCLTVLEFSFILFDLCLFITIFNFVLNYVPIVTFWIFTYHKIWILLIIFCFIWSYWIIIFQQVWKCFGVLWVNWCQFAVALANKVKIGLAF